MYYDLNVYKQILSARYKSKEELKAMIPGYDDYKVKQRQIKEDLIEIDKKNLLKPSEIGELEKILLR
ncbi:MAG: hypothetical protein ACTSRP_26550 [Candidatus Helarchaeota archaeon]